MADVASSLAAWSATTNSNSPAGTATVGTGMDDNIREVQGVIVRGLSNKGADIASATTTDLGAVEGLMHDITGTTTITAFGTVRAGIWKVIKFEGALTLTHNGTSLILPGGANITTADGDIAIVISEGSGNWRCVSYVKAATGAGPVKNATRQVFTSGSGTYTTPAGAVRLNVRLVGAGGGGAGNAAGAATAGGDTTFSTLTGSGGAAGNALAGGAGGATSGGDFGFPGGKGGGGGQTATANTFLQGGHGGISFFGGGGAQGVGNANGGDGATNTGSGGGGGGGASAGNSGGGGGAGGYVDKIITSPAATYSYGVGAGGAGSAGTGSTGGTGAAGLIVVDEFYA